MSHERCLSLTKGDGAAHFPAPNENSGAKCTAMWNRGTRCETPSSHSF
jgi:hypothetical protein